MLLDLSSPACCLSESGMFGSRTGFGGLENRLSKAIVPGCGVVRKRRREVEEGRAPPLPAVRSGGRRRRRRRRARPRWGRLGEEEEEGRAPQ